MASCLPNPVFVFRFGAMIFLVSLFAANALAQQEGIGPVAAAHEASDPDSGDESRERSEAPRFDWLEFGGQFRTRFETRNHTSTAGQLDDGYLLTRVRAHLGIRPAQGFRLFLEVQDSQAGGLRADPDPPFFENRIDIRQAFAELRRSRAQGWGARIGRQELNFGEQRLIGALNWGNTARSFDVARIYYENETFRIDAFAGSVVRIERTRFDRRADGDTLYGSYLTMPQLAPGTGWELYVLQRSRAQIANEQGTIGDSNRTSIGTRVDTSLAESTRLGVEVVGQFGNAAGDAIRAAAAHVRLSHTLSRTPASPTLLVEYNFASGDDEQSDGRVGTFDQLFPTNHNKYGIADLIGWRNIRNLRLGF